MRITHPSPRDLALFGIYLVVVIDMMASALTVPVMPFYVMKLGGASSSLGFMFSVFAIAQLVSTSWMGPLSDTVGRRAILTVTLGGAGIGMIGSSIATTFTWLVASRVFIGACSGTMSAANAYIADITNPKERPALMANVGSLVQICFMFGPGIGAGLAELDNRAPFWVGAFTSFFALVIAVLYLKAPEELFIGGIPPTASGRLNLPTAGGSAVADTPAQPTQWRLVGLLAFGSLASNTAFSSIMTCQALFLQAIFGFGSLQFGFVMMGTATFGIIVRSMFFNRIQEYLGLMKTAVLGGIMGTITYAGYSFLDGGTLGMYSFFALAGLGTVGSTFSASSVTPFFSQLGNKKNMGRIMSINSMTSSAGRVIGPTVFGALYAANIRYPYRLASAFTAIASGMYFIVHLSSEERPAKGLAESDAAAQKLSLSTESDQGAALDELMKTVRSTILQRGYDLANPTVVELLTDIIQTALPSKVEGRSDEELLNESAEFVHTNRHAVHFPHT
ncbi:hypothetical protein AB1Y20_004001 [Prymnesium parvum]|uniref:Major facilitator superfamily (MFS) profile domain-containing protein n=1 Tax=Prymnesium parvum TaxID=97485 RepID=A0AB34J8P4_PRYPA